MESPMPLCNEEDEIKDDDSLIDRCWKQQYKGDSRKWLIRDASYKKPRGPLCSTMKESYTYPVDEKKPGDNLGVRRAILLKKFYDEASKEIIEERQTPPPIGEYCTEYDESYKANGFQPEEEPFTKCPELYDKYPLYASSPTTYYSYNLKATPNPLVPGMTKILDPINPFKKSGGFTKPHSEKYDDLDW